MTPDERNGISAQLDEKYSWFNRGCHYWSSLHHGSLYTSAICGASAAILLNLNSLQQWQYVKDTSSILAALGALLATLAASGGFDRKWRANRISRGRIEELRIDLLNVDADGAVFRERLKKIIEAHDQSILGLKN